MRALSVQKNMCSDRLLRLCFYPLNLCCALFFRFLAFLLRSTAQAAWVIGGHRGRIYEDNSAALHKYIADKTNQPVVWIASSVQLAAALRKQGYKVLMRDSIRARYAILRAPVVVYSHGEDDIDTFLKYLRKVLGLRVYLSHCLTHLKTGRFFQPGVESWSSKKIDTYAKKITDFDVLLASSSAEKANLDKAFRFRTDRILPFGGGAHIDNLLAAREVEPENLIVWFPTFRDAADAKVNADKVIYSVLASDEIHNYLKREKLKLAFVGHINSKSTVENHFFDENISFHKPEAILELLAKAMCLISDYSGLTFDWLCFNRPIIHFPFDEFEYFKSRKLLNDLSVIQYGALVRTKDELISLLVSNDWRDTERFTKNRQRWMDIVFPDLQFGYAERCYKSICSIRDVFDSSSRTFKLKTSDIMSA